MPKLNAHDGTALYYEETGDGVPIVFVHEYAGDNRSWEPQVRALSRLYRCITYNARGYPPSGVPGEPAAYSQDHARLDILAVLDGLGIDRAHVCGLSMGGFAALHFGLHHPERARSLVVAGCGYGAERDKREQFRAEALAVAELIEREGIASFAQRYAQGPARVQYRAKDPRGFAEFLAMLAEHDATGARLTQLGYQRERPSLYDLEEAMGRLTVPTLIVTGDEDGPCLQPGLLMKRAIRSAALLVLPNGGHAINLEEPALFNAAILDLFVKADADKWPVREAADAPASILGIDR